MDRRLFLYTSLAASANLASCGGGGKGGDVVTANPLPSAPAPIASQPIASQPIAPTSPAPTTPAQDWPQDYVADTSGRIFYVSPAGNNNAAGTLAAPFATVSHAVTVVAAGDTIVLANGTYAEDVWMTQSGAPGRYITLRAANPGMAKLVGPVGSYSALAMANVGWVRVQGLDVQAHLGHGIESNNSHHIQLVGNTCHDCGGSGISLEAGDYYLVEANAVFRNASTNVHQTSGISIYQARAFDAAAGFHIVIRRNLVHSNVESAAVVAAHSEGNGIILDDFHNSQGGATAGNYSGNTLVENNIVAFNGGDGIAAYESDNVTVRHNTVAFNNTDLSNPATWRAELSSGQGRNNHWYNNLAVCNTQTSPNSNALLEAVTDGFQNTGAAWAGNLLFDVAAPTRNAVLVAGAGNTLSLALVSSSNLLRQDPGFVLPLVAGQADTFRLAANSPAINTALLAQAALVDYANQARGAQPDIGAFERL